MIRERKQVRRGVVVVATLAMAFSVAGPAAAQEIEFGDPVFDHLAISAHEGVPGDVVGAQVDLDAVHEECTTEVAALQAEFGDPGFSSHSWNNAGPVLQAYFDLGPTIGIDVPPNDSWPGTLILPSPPAPSPVYSGGSGPPEAFGVEPLNFAWRQWRNNRQHDPTWWLAYDDPTPDTRLQQGAFFLAGFMDFVARNEGTPATGGAADALLAETFVLTFASLEGELVGGLSNFELGDGAGEVVVPDLPPGIWVVAATCVAPVVTAASFHASASAVVAWMDDNDIPITASWSNNPDFIIGMAGAGMVPLMQPRGGPWVDLFCVVNEDGQCHPDLRDLSLLEELGIDDPGLFDELIDGDGAAPAAAVDSSPRFTG